MASSSMSNMRVEFAGIAHATHEDEPHVATELLLTQTPPHRWYPTLHVKPHDTPSHVEVEFAGIAHATHDDVPHDETALLLTQAPLHRW